MMLPKSISTRSVFIVMGVLLMTFSQMMRSSNLDYFDLSDEGNRMVLMTTVTNDVDSEDGGRGRATLGSGDDQDTRRRPHTTTTNSTGRHPSTVEEEANQKMAEEQRTATEKLKREVERLKAEVEQMEKEETTTTLAPTSSAPTTKSPTKAPTNPPTTSALVEEPKVENNNNNNNNKESIQPPKEDFSKFPREAQYLMSRQPEPINLQEIQNQAQKQETPLNVLILYPDDWRHDSIGGVAPVVQTPFLNRLAREGIRFTHNMVTTSICWISRATLFTGQYVSRHKSYKLRETLFYNHWHNQSWPGLLKQVGYHVGHVGKWQYSDPDNLVPTELFDWTRLHEGRHQWPNKRRGKEGKVIPYRGDIISAAELTRADVSDFLKERPKDKPFALTAAFYPPKAIGASMEPGGQWFPMNYSRALYENATIPMPPYNITESHAKLPPPFTKHEKEGWHRWNQRFSTPEKYQEAMKNYYALVTEVDQACKEIYEELEQQGLLDNTLIIFTTDNGLFHAEHGLAGKWYPYQESIRVPLIIRDPRMQRDKINTLDDDLTLNIDLAPTILGAAGISTPKHMQGRNIADLYVKDGNNKDPWRNEFYYEFPVDHKKKIPMSEAVVRHDIKYIYWPEFGSEELFNLTADPLEQNNIYEDPQYEEILNELRELKDIYKAAVV